jgi:ParB/RepB/Spo0J family partition protein
MGDTTTITRRFDPAVPVDQIARNPRNHRKAFDAAALEELAASIQAEGLLQPIVLREADVVDPDDAQRPCRYEIIAGERRWRAHRLAKLPAIAATIMVGVTPERAMAMALIENLQSERLNPMEEAEGFGDLEALGYSQQQIADEVHKSRGRVSNALRLLDLPDAVKEHMRAGVLTQKHAEGLLRFKAWPRLLAQIADLAVKRGATAAELAKGMPFSADLCRSKAVILIAHDDLFQIGWDYDDPKVYKRLKALPFVAHEARPGMDDLLWVCDVPAWQEWLTPLIQARDEELRKQAEQRAAERAAAQAKQKASKTDANTAKDPAPAVPVKREEPDPLVDLDKIDYDKHYRREQIDAAVWRKIPVEKIELGRSRYSPNRPVEFTRDVPLVDSIKRALGAKRNKAVRAKLDAMWDVALAQLQGIKAITSKDLDRIAGWILDKNYHARKHLGAALADHGLKAGTKLATLEPLVLVKVLLTAVLRGQYSSAHDSAIAAVAEDLPAYSKGWEKRLKEREEAEAEADKAEAAATKAPATKAPAKKSAAKKSAPKKGTAKIGDAKEAAAKEAEKAKREAMVVASLNEGKSPSQVSKETGVSLPQVDGIRRRAIKAGTLKKAAPAAAAAK